MQIRQSRSLRICLVNWLSAFQFRICVKSIGIYFSGFFELRPVTPFFDTDNADGVLLTYVVSDINGDGFVDATDFPVFDFNNQLGVFALLP